MMMTRLGLVFVVALGVGLGSSGCGDDATNGTGGTGAGGAGGVGGMGGSSGATVSVGGIAWSFQLPGLPYGRIDGATVSVLEMPELGTETNRDGEFTIEGVPVGSTATFVLEHDDHPLTYTKTHTIPATGIDDLTFQIPTNFLFGEIADGVVEGGLVESIDPDSCQIVSTFTRYGKTIDIPGHHGEPGAVLSVAPENRAEAGPIYFNDQVFPDPTRDYSSLDGGVLLLNMPPGDYTLSASCLTDPGLMADFVAEYPPEDNADESIRCQTEDVEFQDILMKCRAGVFLNASPSYGLQALPPAE